LNRNKILGRLASRHFRRPQHERGPARNALSERFSAYLKSSKRQSAEKNELSRQVEAFYAAFVDLENSEPDTGILGRVVKEAFRLTVDGVSLPDRLKRASFSPSNLDTREIREINKIANYWRICHSLVHLSRSYRTLFSKIKLESLQPFAPSVWHGNSKTRYVHAEVQIIVYYEMRGPPTWPRAIGASKEACFLCHSFIKAHALFCVSKAHSQIYPQWTIPDLAGYSAETLSRLRRTLIAVNRDVSSALHQASSKRSTRPLPLQSSIDLHRTCLPTPSVTTVRSRSPVENVASEIASLSPSRPVPAASEPQLLENSLLSLSRTFSALSTITAPSSSSGEVSSDDANVRVGSESPCPGWLDLYISLERSSVKHPSSKYFKTASIDQKCIPNNAAINGRNCHRLNLDTLAPGEEVVLHNPASPNEDGKDDTEMSIVFTYQKMDTIMLKCTWHDRATSCV
jgi:hypothetical protein